MTQDGPQRAAAKVQELNCSTRKDGSDGRPGRSKAAAFGGEAGWRHTPQAAVGACTERIEGEKEKKRKEGEREASRDADLDALQLLYGKCSFPRTPSVDELPTFIIQPLKYCMSRLGCNGRGISRGFRWPVSSRQSAGPVQLRTNIVAHGTSHQ